MWPWIADRESLIVQGRSSLANCGCPTQAFGWLVWDRVAHNSQLFVRMRLYGSRSPTHAQRSSIHNPRSTIHHSRFPIHALPLHERKHRRLPSLQMGCGNNLQALTRRIPLHSGGCPIHSVFWLVWVFRAGCPIQAVFWLVWVFRHTFCNLLFLNLQLRRGV